MSPRSEDFWGLALALAIVIGTVVLANILPARHAAPAAPSVDAACAEWTDGCVVCRRTDQGPACSTPGIACVKGELHCLAR